MKWSGRVSKKLGLCRACRTVPTFASPDRILEMLIINTVYAKIDPLLVRIVLSAN